ncbi:UNVERIFIED_CONTAM: tRNA(m5U54)methyltransferase [Siphonaria sp. JEL0065]|nr:tRNA(m5U54)methyltransferase [Siphonaria sp. JEL0065]
MFRLGRLCLRVFHSTPPRLARDKSLTDYIGTHTLSRLKDLGVDFSGTNNPTKKDVATMYPLQQPVSDLTVSLLSSNGLGVCVKDGWLFVSPLVLPGEKVTLKPYQHHNGVSLCDLISVQEMSSDRVLPKCEFFETCSSCSLQHLDYKKQLEAKHEVITHSFKNLVPKDRVLPFQESPLQFGVRTKLTPHNPRIHKDTTLDAIGFLKRGAARTVVDIPNCVIATDAVNEGLRKIRALAIGSKTSVPRLGTTYMVRQTFAPQSNTKTKHPLPPFSSPDPNQSRTMKLEDFIKRVKQSPQSPLSSTDPTPSSTTSTNNDKTLAHQLNQTPTPTIQPYPPKNLHATSVTSTKTTILDIVNGHVLRTGSNSFFQNNSHILPHLVTYVSSQFTSIHPSLRTTTLIDAYCGSGIFAITQSHHFQNVIGIELEAASIGWARQNATDNGISNTRFIGGDVNDVFSGVEAMIRQMNTSPSATTPSASENIGDDVSLLVDPPKKGCGKAFLNQVMRLNPRVIVYVSCNPDSAVIDLETIMTLGREGVVPQSFSGSVGGIVRGEEELGKVKPVSTSRVLFLGGKRLVRRGGEEVEVQDVESVNGYTKASDTNSIKGSGEVEPVTLLKVKGYKILQAKPFDMFPQTHRSEVVITLVREDYYEKIKG